MMNQLRIPSSWASTSAVAQTVATLVATIALLLAANIPACAQTDKTPADKPPTYSVLYAFTGGADGFAPYGNNPLAVDREGNVYGTTMYGGDFVEYCQPGVGCGPVGSPSCPIGCGTVFKVNRDGKESVEYTFTGVATEQNPQNNVIRDEEGNLYGSAYAFVYKISPSGHETDLYQFTGNGDGGGASAALIRDREGNLYGVSTADGEEEPLRGCPYSVEPYGTCGVVFKIDPRGSETVLYTFTGGADGGGPQEPLVRDEEGNLYGTTLNGGEVNSLACTANLKGCGVIFKIDRNGKETVLHTFDGVDGGSAPPDATGLTLDRDGTLYGTTRIGGQGPNQQGWGTVFKLERNGKFTTLYSFTGKADGGTPTGPPLLIGKDLYGTTAGGGKLDDSDGGGPPFYGTSGIIYKLDQSGKETVLYTFQGKADGANPLSQLAQDDEGNLYGTTFYGGTFNGEYCESSGCGVVYKLTLHNKCNDDRHRHDGWPDPFSNHDDWEK
jgi:uncharacterized repeat protein (TIGR03803 family)